LNNITAVNLGKCGLSVSQKGELMKASKGKIALAVAAFAVLMLLSAGIIRTVSGKPSIQDPQDPNRRQARTLITFPSIRDPFEILDINREGTKIKPYMQFEEGGDWLRNLRFKINNRSEHPIIAICIGLAFPEAIRDNSPGLMTYVIELGHRPNARAVSGREPICLIQNDVLTFELTDEHLTRINKFLAKRGFSSEQITNVELLMMEVYFANGLAWIGGSMMEPDRTKPGSYIRIKS
jgi:hypothetical protein